MLASLFKTLPQHHYPHDCKPYPRTKDYLLPEAERKPEGFTGT